MDAAWSNFLFQVGLLGRHCRSPCFLPSLYKGALFSHRPCHCVSSLPAALTSCVTTLHLNEIMLWLVFTFGDGLFLASPEYSHPKPSGGEPPIRAHASAYEFSPDPTHRAHSTTSFNCGHHCSQWGTPSWWGTLLSPPHLWISDRNILLNWVIQCLIRS